LRRRQPYSRALVVAVDRFSMAALLIPTTIADSELAPALLCSAKTTLSKLSFLK
jgi:hypothetical protein